MSLELSDYFKCALELRATIPANEPRWRWVLKGFLCRYIQTNNPICGLFRHHQQTAVSLLASLEDNPEAVDPAQLNAHLAASIKPDGGFARLIHAFSLLFPHYALSETSKLFSGTRSLKRVDAYIARVLRMLRQGESLGETHTSIIAKLAPQFYDEELLAVIPVLWAEMQNIQALLSSDVELTRELSRRLSDLLEIITALRHRLNPLQVTAFLNALIDLLRSSKFSGQIYQHQITAIRCIKSLVPLLTAEKRLAAAQQLFALTPNIAHLTITATLSTVVCRLTPEQREEFLGQVYLDERWDEPAERMQLVKQCCGLGEYLNQDRLNTMLLTLVSPISDLQNQDIGTLQEIVIHIDNFCLHLDSRALLATLLPALMRRLSDPTGPQDFLRQCLNAQMALVLKKISSRLTEEQRQGFVLPPEFLVLPDQMNKGGYPYELEEKLQAIFCLADYLPRATLDNLAQNLFRQTCSHPGKGTWENFSVIAQILPYLTIEQQTQAWKILAELFKNPASGIQTPLQKQMIARLAANLPAEWLVPICESLLRNFHSSVAGKVLSFRDVAAVALSSIATSSKAAACYILTELRRNIPTDLWPCFKDWVDLTTSVETTLAAMNERDLRAAESDKGHDSNMAVALRV